MDHDSSMKSSAKKKKAKFSSDAPIKLIKPRSFDDLIQSSSSSNSIRRRKTDFDVQSTTWTNTSAQDFVTLYLRLKVKHRRIKHLRTSSILGDTLSPPMASLSGSFMKSSFSIFPEEIHRRSSKEVIENKSYAISLIDVLLQSLINLDFLHLAFRFILLGNSNGEIHRAVEY